METVINFIMAMLQHLSETDSMFNVDWQDFMQVDIIDNFVDGMKDTYKAAGADINGFFVDLCNKHLVGFGMSMANSYTSMARGLGAVFSIIVAANMAYKMMTEGEGIKVMKLLRPLGFAFMLANWSIVCTALLGPGQAIENRFNTMYGKAAELVAQSQDRRQQLADSVRNVIITQHEVTQMQKQQAAQETGESKSMTREFLDFVWRYNVLNPNMGDNIVNDGKEMILPYIRGWGLSIMTWVYWTIESILCGIGKILFACGSYIIFMMKALFITVLVIFGPISIVCSILGIWKDAWVTWISRMVHVSLYGAMAYLVMTYSMMIINFAVDADCTKLAAILQNPSTGVAAYLAGGFGTSCMCVVGYMVGCFAFAAVPEMATFAFPGSTIMGGSTFVSGMAGQAKKYTGTGKML